MLVLPPGWSLGGSSPAQTVGRGLGKVPEALRRQYTAVGEPQEGHTAPGTLESWLHVDHRTQTAQQHIREDEALLGVGAEMG